MRGTDTVLAGIEGGDIDGNQVYLTENNGTTWVNVSGGLPYNMGVGVTSLAMNGKTVFAGTNSGGIYHSDFTNVSWTGFNYIRNGTIVTSLALSGGAIFAGILPGGVFFSNNYSTWIQVNNGLPDTVTSLAAHGSMLFAGTTGGIYLSTDSGLSWSQAASGLADRFIISLAVCDSTLFAETDNGLYFRPLSEIVGVIYNKTQTHFKKQTALILSNSIRSNHTVTINFTLAQSQTVNLRIYDLSGREITTIVNTTLEAGKHNLSWDTKNVAAGNYAVKMQVGSKVVVKNIPVSR
jgi:hypothetical protein